MKITFDVTVKYIYIVYYMYAVAPMSDRPKQMSLNPSTVLFVYFEILVFNLPIYEKRQKSFSRISEVLKNRPFLAEMAFLIN